MNSNRIELKPNIYFESGIIEIETKSFFNDHVMSHTRDILNTKENMVHDCLVKLGWTPPNKQG